MSYYIEISVKVEGCDKYAKIAEPKYNDPTYNLGKMFRVCMGWDYSQSEPDETGKYVKKYYPCDFVIEKVETGIRELRTNRKKYEQYKPSNGWGSMSSAIEALESLRACIYEEAEYIPINCLYMSW